MKLSGRLKLKIYKRRESATWYLGEKDKNKAFKMYVKRKIKRTKWVDGVNTKEVLK